MGFVLTIGHLVYYFLLATKIDAKLCSNLNGFENGIFQMDTFLF